MPRCAKIQGIANNIAVDDVVTHNPDGTVASRTPRTDFQNCQFVVQSGSEFTNWDQLTHMTIEDAEVIGASVAVVWAIAWGFRAIRLAVSDYRSDGD